MREGGSIQGTLKEHQEIIFLLLIIDRFNHDEHDVDDCHDADDDDAKNVDWTLCLLLV